MTPEDKKNQYNAFHRDVMNINNATTQGALAIYQIKKFSLWEPRFQSFAEYRKKLPFDNGYISRLLAYGEFAVENAIPADRLPAETALRPLLKRRYNDARKEIYHNACRIAKKNSIPAETLPNEVDTPEEDVVDITTISPTAADIRQAIEVYQAKEENKISAETAETFTSLLGKYPKRFGSVEKLTHEVIELINKKSFSAEDRDAALALAHDLQDKEFKFLDMALHGGQREAAIAGTDVSEESEKNKKN
jgi:hypothetical protein